MVASSSSANRNRERNMTSKFRDKLFIGGGWTPGRSGRTFEVVNPSTEEVLGAVPRGTPEDVDDAVGAAEAAAEVWRRVTPEDRGRLLYGVARSLEARLEEFARLETLDTGKPLGHARGELSGCVRYFDYYAGVDRKSTRLNSSHANISYAVFCLKKKNKTTSVCVLRAAAVAGYAFHNTDTALPHDNSNP